jgi:hypothetical protein
VNTNVSTDTAAATTTTTKEKIANVGEDAISHNPIEWKSLQEVPIIAWSLQSLSEAGSVAITKQPTTDNSAGSHKIGEEWTRCHSHNNQKIQHDILRLVLDVACRLERQIDRLKHLQATVQQIKINPCIELDPETARLRRLHELFYSNHQSVTDVDKFPISSSSSSSTLRLKRPYWWTYSQENQLQQELESAIKNIDNLLRLHQDTQSHAMDLYRHWTKKSFNDVCDDSCDNKILKARRLHKVCSEIHSRHALTIEQMSSLVIGLRPLVQPPSLYRTILDFLKARLMIQLLCDHITLIGKRLELEYESLPTDDVGEQGKGNGGGASRALQLQHRYNSTTSAATLRSSVGGAVSVQQDVKNIVDAAVNEASTMCEAHFLTRPPVYIVDAVLFDDDKDENMSQSQKPSETNQINATFIRPWLQYTLVETLKNALAVTIENPNPQCTHQKTKKNKSSCASRSTEGDDDGDDEEESLMTKNHCPVYISISQTEKDVLIHIMDQGGGFPQSVAQSTLFAFAQCHKQWDRLEDQQTYAATRSPLRGLGVGLSLSKMQMQKFGGDLVLRDRGSNSEASGELSRICKCENVQGVLIRGGSTRDGDCFDEWVMLERGVTATLRIPRDTTIVSSVY